MILKHCGIWKGPPSRSPPIQITTPALLEPALGSGFSEKTWGSGGKNLVRTHAPIKKIISINKVGH